jgi:small subunit ribosomal protein S18
MDDNLEPTIEETEPVVGAPVEPEATEPVVSAPVAPEATEPVVSAPVAPESPAPRVAQESRSSSGGGGERGGDRGGGRRRFTGRAKVCTFCVDKNSRIDYKDYDTLRRYITDRAKIRPRRQTGTCARHQRTLARAIKRARHLALLPFIGPQIREG